MTPEKDKLPSPVAQLVGMLAALQPPSPAQKLIPGHYAEDFCSVCKAPAGTRLPCGFCPKPITPTPTGKKLE